MMTKIAEKAYLLSVYCSMQFHVLKSSFSSIHLLVQHRSSKRCSAKLSVSQCNTDEQVRECTEESVSQTILKQFHKSKVRLNSSPASPYSK